MEIDFNTSRVPKPGLGQPIAVKGTARPASDGAVADSISTTAPLASQLNDLPLVRPEKVDQARALVSATNYPPVELLVRIAALLGVHLKS